MLKKILFLITCIPSILLAQHTIKGKFTPAKEFKFAILYKITPTTSIYVNNASISEEGDFEFKLDSTANKGIYRIVYALPQDEFNFDILFNNKEDIELSFNLEEGVNYTKSKENILLTSYHKSMETISNSLNAFYANNNPSEKEFKNIFSTLEKTQTEFEKAAKGTLAYHFIKASKPYIPTTFEDAKSYTKNLKENYYKNINFSDETLQSSSFLIESVLNYVLVLKDSDQTNNEKEYIEKINTTIHAIGNNNTFKETILEILWNQFADLQNEPVANYIANQYLIPIAKQNKDIELVTKLTIFNNISLGKVAPDFTLEIPNEADKMDLIKLANYNHSKNYIIVFWSSTCSHCLKEMPQLHEYLKNTDTKEIQVIAIGLENEPYRWKDTTYKFPKFIHIYGEGKWDNPIGDAYGVTATPTYFILDADKKITAKPYDFEAVKKHFADLKNKEKTTNNPEQQN